MPSTFMEFVDKKTRESIKHLDVIKRILMQSDLQVSSHIHSKKDDPFLFVYNPESSSGINFGVRIYTIGEQLAYRAQRKENTHPYGGPHSLDIEQIWDDIKADGKEDEEAAEEIVKSVAEEIKDFFKKSAKADKEVKRNKGEEGPLGSVALTGTGTDYSNKVFELPSR